MTTTTVKTPTYKYSYTIGNQAILIDNALDIIVAAKKTHVLAYTKRPVYARQDAGTARNLSEETASKSRPHQFLPVVFRQDASMFRLLAAGIPSILLSD